MIKYRTRWNEIQMVEVESETDLSVWIKGRRNAKRTEWECFWDTEDGARKHLINVAQLKIENAERNASTAKDELNKAKTAIVKPISNDQRS